MTKSRKMTERDVGEEKVEKVEPFEVAERVGF